MLLMPASESGAVVRAGAIELDRLARKVRRGGRELRLGPVEFRLLDLLLGEPGRIFSRAEILAAVWGSESATDLRTIDAHVRHLRRALGRTAIVTARGQGYGFNASAGS